MNLREEYPRPELVRKNWMNLNGEWDFDFDFGNNGLIYDRPQAETDERVKNGLINTLNRTFTKKINVPFCAESKLSGLGYTDFYDACWYKRSFEIPKTWKGRVLLHFEASFYRTVCFLNGKKLGEHKGGYTPFTFDITDYLSDGKGELIVHAEGDARNVLQPSGKQSEVESRGCFYTRTTGIWQTVWLENVPETYLSGYKVKTDIYNKTADFELKFNNYGKKTVDMTVSFKGEKVSCKQLTAYGKILNVSLNLPEVNLWTVETPDLYDLNIGVTSDTGYDEVFAYFGMREISIDKDRFLLNGKPVFQRLVLDQGFYPDGIYTAPTDEALKNDVIMSKRIGFNGARLHEKVFERRFLYYADKLGYLCWGEYPSWGFDYTDRANTDLYAREWLESVERDFNHPCIIGWCPMNENWNRNGRRQSDELVLSLYEVTKLADPTRPVIDVSWNYHVKTDVFDTHNYWQDTDKFGEAFGSFKEGEVFDDFKQKYEGQPFFVSEYGGIGWKVGGTGSWSYGDKPKTEREYIDRFVKLTEILMGNPKICGLCYTQLYDVEQEQNGVYNYDRTPKFDDKLLDELNACLSQKAKYEE